MIAYTPAQLTEYPRNRLLYPKDLLQRRAPEIVSEATYSLRSNKAIRLMNLKDNAKQPAVFKYSRDILIKLQEEYQNVTPFRVDTQEPDNRKLDLLLDNITSLPGHYFDDKEVLDILPLDLGE